MSFLIRRAALEIMSARLVIYRTDLDVHAYVHFEISSWRVLLEILMLDCFLLVFIRSYLKLTSSVLSSCSRND